MNNVILTKQSSLVDKKMYFTAVLNLSKSGEEFPVDFDEVWQLVYSAKNKAVAELKDKFLQNVDYQLIDQKVHASNPQGYVWEHKYYLTVSCLEFFIARKDREVFEIYRQVFHRVANGDFKQPQRSPSQPKLSDKIQAAKFLAKFLNLNDASKLQIAKTIADPLGLPTPDYVMDEKTVHAAKDLLVSHNVKMSSAEFNKILVSKGIVERMTRPGKGGKTHSWVVIPEKFEKFGQNARNPHAQNQTQALWYDNKFSELLALAGIQEGKEEESHD